MQFDFIGMGIKLGIDTVFLTVALWILVKVQSLDGKFPGLIGAAAAASALELIPFVGHYVALIVLLLCIKKITNADMFPDVVFTVVVSGALTFCMNMFLLTALLPDMHYAGAHGPKEDGDSTEIATAPASTNASSASTNAAKLPVASKTNAPAAVAVAAPPAPKANPPAAAPTPAPTPATPADTSKIKSAKEIAQNFVVRGVISGTAAPVATIYTGVRTHNIFLGETVTMETKDGRIEVRCDELTDNKVVLTINGEQVTLHPM